MGRWNHGIYGIYGIYLFCLVSRPRGKLRYNDERIRELVSNKRDILFRTSI